MFGEETFSAGLYHHPSQLTMLGICYENVKGDFYDKIFHLNEHRKHIQYVHPNHQLLEPSLYKIQLISGHVDYSYYYQSENLLQHTNFLLSLSLRKKIKDSAPSLAFVLLCGITVELDELVSRQESIVFFLTNFIKAFFCDKEHCVFSKFSLYLFHHRDDFTLYMWDQLL